MRLRELQLANFAEKNFDGLQNNIKLRSSFENKQESMKN